MNVLNVLGLLIEFEPQQTQLLEKSGPLISREELRLAKALDLPPKLKKTRKRRTGPHLFVTKERSQA